jgi:hypothetical protein
MRALFGVLLLLVPAATRADRGEVEIAGGAGGVSLPGSLQHDPVLSVRVGYDLWDFFSPGVRVTGVLGPEGLDFIGGGTPLDPTGDRAWSVLAEVRLHTPGRVQALVDLGAGLGRLVRIQGASDETLATVGDVGPAFQAGGGLRVFVVPGFAVGLGAAVMRWTHTHSAPHSGPLPSITGIPSDSSKGGVVFWGSLAAAFDL